MLLGSLILWMTISEPYSFEIDPGISLEIKSGVHLNDRVDDTAYPIGGRLSYMNTSETDAFLAPEFSADYEILPKKTGSPSRRYSFLLGLALYETYNPFAFRVGVGAGGENRADQWSSLISARGGLGFYFNPDWAMWVDIAQRWVFRSPWSYPLSIEGSLQFVF